METAMKKRTRVIDTAFDTPGKRLAQLRRTYGWTQKGIVEKLNRKGVSITSQGYLSEMEKAQDAGDLPGGKLLRSFAEIYETSVDYLLMLTDDDAPPAHRDADVLAIDLIDPALREDLVALARYYQVATPEHRRAMLTFMRAFTVV